VTLRQIRYFIAVAETGKIAAASTMVGISPSVITGAIAELEQLSGVTLFDRHPRGLQPTYEGLRFLSHARNILSAIQGASAAIVRPDSELYGTVTLAATITVMSYFLAPLVAKFQRVFPNIAVSITEAPREKIEAGLISGEYDVAIMLSSNLANKDHLLIQALVHSKRRLWLPSGHALLQNEVVTLTDVSSLPYIQLLIDDAEASTAEYWERHGLAPQIVIRTESVEAIRGLIANRHGVTILSDMMYRPWSLEGDRIEVCDLAADIPMLTTGVVWPRDRTPSPSVRAFINFCQTNNDAREDKGYRQMPPPAV
jgi:DNA-binding transcriptional LysR family regulator